MYIAGIDPYNGMVSSLHPYEKTRCGCDKWEQDPGVMLCIRIGFEMVRS